MTSVLHELKRYLPEPVKAFVAKQATPRVVERERALWTDVEDALLGFVAKIEAEIRVTDADRLRVLDSEDVRAALSDLRARGAHLAASLNRRALGADALLTFVVSVTDLGIGGIRAARTPDEVADATSRAVDNIEGYMVNRNQLLDDVFSLDAIPAEGVRKLSRPVSLERVAVWRTAHDNLVAFRF